jgi:hypothetical protein
MGLQIIEDREIWDSFIQQSPHGDIFHLWDCLKIIEKHSRCQLFTYGILNGKNLIALAPIFHKKIFGLDFLFSPPPKTAVPYLGFVLDGSYGSLHQKKKEHVLRLIADEIIPEINSYTPNTVYISNPPGQTDFREFVWKGYELIPHYTYFLDLNPDLDSIFAGFTRQRRQNIKKAENQGFEVRHGGDLSVLFDALEKRYMEQGLSIPLISKEYLLEVYSTLPEYLELYTVEEGGNVGGSILVTKFKDVKLWLGTGSCSRSCNELLIWNIIQDAKRNNFSSCDFVGANTKNLCKFKNQFNPSLKVSYGISKNDMVGKLSRTLYFSFMRKSRMH